MAIVKPFATQPPDCSVETERARLERIIIPCGKGTKCGACEQNVKGYRRQVYDAMAVGLIYLHRWHETKGYRDGWCKMPDLHSRIPRSARFHGGDFAKLVYWGLIEKLKGKRPDGSKRTGFYRLTDAGLAFVLGKSTIQQYALVYNAKLRAFEGPLITIYDALTTNFDYAQLMKLDLSVEPKEPR